MQNDLYATAIIAVYENLKEGWSHRFISSRRIYLIQYFKSKGSATTQTWRPLGENRYLPDEEVANIRERISEKILIRDVIRMDLL